MPSSTLILAMLALVAAKAMVLVGLGVVASRLLRRSSAACRHVAWTAVLGGVVLLAVSSPLPPIWSLPLGVSMALPGRAEPGVAASVPETRPAAVANGAVAAVPGDDGIAGGQGRQPVAAALVLLWLSGVGLLALRLVAGRVALRRIGARGRPVEPGALLARFALPQCLGLRLRRVRLIETDALSTPATWGVFRTVVALPAGAAAWPSDRLGAAVRHELAHVQRRDALTQTLADLCCCLLWFHPGVWFAGRRMRVERERACDDAVLSAGTPAVGYAELLLALAAGVSRGAPGRARIAMTEARDLEVRLRAILDPATTRRVPRSLMASVPLFALLATFLTAGLGVVATAPLRAADAMPTQDPQLPTPDETEMLLGERVPLTVEQERQALQRQFRPRDEHEARALALLRAATGHVPQHAMDFVRDRAFWALWVAQPEQVTDTLVAELENVDWRVRAYAAWSLGLVGAPAAQHALLLRLRDPAWRVRAHAAHVLAALADPRSFDDMLPLLDDSAWQVRVAAVEYLGHIGTPAARAAVQASVRDRHVAVRTAAETALGAHTVR